LGLNYSLEGDKMSEELNRLIEIEREAEEIVEKARAEANRILEEARSKAEKILKEAEEISFPEVEEEYKRKIDEELAKIEETFRKEAESVYSTGIKNLEKAVDYIVRKVIE